MWIPFEPLKFETLRERKTRDPSLTIFYVSNYEIKTKTYSRFQAKWCMTFVVLAQLLSHSGCPNVYDNHVWSHTHHLLPFAATEPPVYGHRSLGNTNFWLQKNLWYSMVSITTSKPFCLLKCIWQQSWISNPTYFIDLGHWNCCLWSQNSWKSDSIIIELMLWTEKGTILAKIVVQIQ